MVGVEGRAFSMSASRLARVVIAAVASLAIVLTSFETLPNAQAAVPTAPATLNAVVSSGQAVLTWTAPSSNGGKTITGYKVERSLDAGSTWSSISSNVGNVLTYTVNGLTNGTPYTFRVSAINADGFGATLSSPTVTPIGLASAPLNAVVTTADRALTVTWEPPPSNGGAPVTGYEIRRSATSATSGFTTVVASADPATRSYTLSGLTNGTFYWISVSAVTSAGVGAASVVAGQPFALASAPTAIYTVAGDRQATIYWGAPTQLNGTAVAGYRLDMSSNGGTTWSVVSANIGNVTSFTVAGLSNGTQYTFRVRALRNDDGLSAAATAIVVPVTTAGKPRELTAVGSDSTVALAWTTPSSSGGTAIVGYEISRSTDGVNYAVITSDAGTAQRSPVWVCTTALATGSAFGLLRRRGSELRRSFNQRLVCSQIRCVLSRPRPSTAMPRSRGLLRPTMVALPSVAIELK